MPRAVNATTIRAQSFDVVGLGLNAMDTICTVPTFPRPTSKTPMSAITVQPGGQVATALVTCSRLGLRTCYIGSVGSDDTGQRQAESLRAEGLDLRHLRYVPETPSQTAIILIEEGVGERTILWHRDPRLEYPVDALDRETILSAKALHLDGCDGAAALKAATWAREAGIPVTIDIDEIYDDTTGPLLRMVDHIIGAEEFGQSIGQTTNPRDAVRAVAERFRPAVAGLTLGAQGAIFYCNGEYLHCQGVAVPVTDTTGAGDVFHGAYIYGLLHGWSLPEIGRFANATAALKCMRLGARTGIPPLEQVQAFLSSSAL